MSVPVNQLLQTLPSRFFCFRQNSSLVSFTFIWEWEFIDWYKIIKKPQHSFLQLSKKACVKTLPNHQWLPENNLPITCLSLPMHEFLSKYTFPPLLLLQNNSRDNKSYLLLLCIQSVYFNKLLRNLRAEQLISKLIYQDVAINRVADK